MDLTSTSVELTLQPSMPSSCVPITITDDVLLENSEDFSISLSSSDRSVSFGDPSSSITILDNDSMWCMALHVRCRVECTTVNFKCSGHCGIPRSHV